MRLSSRHARYSVRERRTKLVDHYAGREIAVGALYEQHSVDTPYIMRNYKDLLKVMEEGKIVTVRSADPAKKRRTGTMADHLLVKFPTSKGVN